MPLRLLVGGVNRLVCKQVYKHIVLQLGFALIVIIIVLYVRPSMPKIFDQYKEANFKKIIKLLFFQV